MFKCGHYEDSDQDGTYERAVPFKNGILRYRACKVCNANKGTIRLTEFYEEKKHDVSTEHTRTDKSE